MHPGLHLKTMREDCGYSLRELAKKSGYSLGYLSDIESGRRLPAPFALKCILGALSVHEKKPEVLAMYLDARIKNVC
ncbi:MAG: helix-turn-helix transcriptional regulator [Pseudobdellovibrionaceae bacterium]|nr:helix-turn-helix transcriptional regulator [Pseudobdellovibrionaceae bacterium]